jgi:hypothetical protein
MENKFSMRLVVIIISFFVIAIGMDTGSNSKITGLVAVGGGCDKDNLEIEINPAGERIVKRGQAVPYTLTIKSSDTSCSENVFILEVPYRTPERRYKEVRLDQDTTVYVLFPTNQGLGKYKLNFNVRGKSIRSYTATKPFNIWVVSGELDSTELTRFKLSSPIRTIDSSQLQPEFGWNNLEDAGCYQLYVQDKASGTKIIDGKQIRASGGQQSSYRSEKRLLNGINYKWWVNAYLFWGGEGVNCLGRMGYTPSKEFSIGAATLATSSVGCDPKDTQIEINPPPPSSGELEVKRGEVLSYDLTITNKDIGRDCPEKRYIRTMPECEVNVVRGCLAQWGKYSDQIRLKPGWTYSETIYVIIPDNLDIGSKNTLNFSVLDLSHTKLGRISVPIKVVGGTSVDPLDITGGPEGNVRRSLPTFRWDPVVGAECYKFFLQYKRGNRFSDTIKLKHLSLTNSYFLSGVRLERGNYRWLVQAYNIDWDTSLSGANCVHGLMAQTGWKYFSIDTPIEAVDRSDAQSPTTITPPPPTITPPTSDQTTESSEEETSDQTTDQGTGSSEEETETPEEETSDQTPPEILEELARIEARTTQIVPQSRLTTTLFKPKDTEGWNLIYVTTHMIDKSIADMAGEDCGGPEGRWIPYGYLYDDSNGEWSIVPGTDVDVIREYNLETSEDERLEILETIPREFVGAALWLKVHRECVLTCGFIGCEY